MRERDEAENEHLLNGDNDDSDEDDDGGIESSSDEENENDCIGSGDRDESSDVILTFIDGEEVEIPAARRLGRAITRRSETDFSFVYFFNEFRARWYISFLLTLWCKVKSDRCKCSMNCNTLIMPKRYCVTVKYV